MLLGGWLSAEQALDWGLVQRVAPAGRVTEVLDQIAGELAALSLSAGRTAKALANRALDVDLGTGLALEKAMVAEHMRSADAVEGLRAFREKRKPRFA
jgi:enoyl-CoA hydratase